MVDVLQSYMQDAISLVRLHRTDNTNHDDHGTTDYGAKRRATEKQRLRIQYKEQEKQNFDRSLYQIKESPLQSLQLTSKPLHGLACKFCAPSTKVSILAFICLFIYLSIRYQIMHVSSAWIRLCLHLIKLLSV